jgi:hypothetical protein
MTPNIFMPPSDTAYSSAATPIFRSPKGVYEAAVDFGVWNGSVGRRPQRGRDQSKLFAGELSGLGK